jgi:hypothetical protein
MYCSAFLKNEIPGLWDLVDFEGLSRDNSFGYIFLPSFNEVIGMIVTISSKFS